MSASALPLHFFLGGHDLEMVAIADLLRAQGAVFSDRGLSWGARASDYRDELAAALAAGRRPVLVELPWDLPEALRGQVVEVDHHGARAGDAAPTSLHQVFGLLGLPPSRWTRWLALVAANDRGYIPELLKLGASRSEIEQVRAADRAAQGITADQEAAAAAALAHIQWRHAGRLALARLPHAKTSALTDRLDPALGGPGVENLLVECPGELDFYGSGRCVVALDQQFPGGWSGGALPAHGFWGTTAPVDVQGAAAVLERVIDGGAS